MEPMLGVPLNATRSNMSAEPVAPAGSLAEPASTQVRKETTGASWRSMTMKCRPLARLNSVTFFSNSFRS